MRFHNAIKWFKEKPMFNSFKLILASPILLVICTFLGIKFVVAHSKYFLNKCVSFLKNATFFLTNGQRIKQIYFQDKPVDDYKSDYIGFETEVDMLLDEIVNGSKVIGLVSDYGSGKSSIISLLESTITNIINSGKSINQKSKYEFKTNDVKKINVIKVNLFDDDGKINYNEKLELHKKMIVEIAKRKDEKFRNFNIIKKALYYLTGKKKNINYILKRLNPTYRVIDVDTSHNSTKVFFIVGLVLIFLNLLYKTGIMSLWKFNMDERILKCLRYICTSGGIIGFLLLIMSAIIGKLVISYSKNYCGLEFGEYDAQLLFNKVMDDYDVIVLEDLDRLAHPRNVRQFINEIYSYYSSIKKITFILPITQFIFSNMDVTTSYKNANENVVTINADKNTKIEIKQDIFNKASNTENLNESKTELHNNSEENMEECKVETFDSKYKLFTSVLYLPKIKNSDYVCILQRLLANKKEGLNEDLKGILDLDNPTWEKLAYGKNLNIRIVKHRINEAIHLALLNNSRFGSVKIESCIIFTYLKEEYGKEFDDLIKETGDSAQKTYVFKNIVDEFLKCNEKGNFEKFSSVDKVSADLQRDIIDALNNQHIDYDNYEHYIFNTSKLNGRFNTDEINARNAYLSNCEYESDEKIQELIDKNDEWLKDIIDRRRGLYNNDLIKSLPSNIFKCIPIYNYIFDKLSTVDRHVFYTTKLPLNELYHNTTISLIEQISNTFTSDILSEYISIIKAGLNLESEIDTIINIRKRLLSIFNDKQNCLVPLYASDFPIISLDELDLVLQYGNNIYDFMNAHLLNNTNIGIYVNYVNKINGLDKEKTNLYFKNIGDDCVDNVSKTLHSLKTLSKIDKLFYYEEYKNLIRSDSVAEILSFITNIDFSYAELEQKVIDMVPNIIDINAYSKFVNSLPFVNKNTLDFLSKDDCFFSIDNKILNQFKKEKMIYEYYKYKTINDGKIPVIKKKTEYFIYERFYTNALFKFKEYILESEHFVNHIITNKIYRNCDPKYAVLLNNANQNYDLLDYIFANHCVIDVNLYLSNVKKLGLTCGEFKMLYAKYKDLMDGLDYTIKENLHNAAVKYLKAQIKRIFKL